MELGMSELIVTGQGVEFWQDGERVANQQETRLSDGQFLLASIYYAYGIDYDPHAGVELADDVAA